MHILPHGAVDVILPEKEQTSLLHVKTNILVKLNPQKSENGLPEKHSQFLSSKKTNGKREGLHETGQPGNG